MPRGWRIVKASHAAAAFDGEGARLYGGRWNSPGSALVYTAQSEALAALELLVHLRAPQLLASYVSIPADFDEELVEVLPAARLPSGWRRYPAASALQRIGDRWVAEGRSAVLRVPSAVVPRESNYLLNPAHRAFARVAVGRPAAFEFDGRLR
jgi:RES domain-containing protein